MPKNQSRKRPGASKPDSSCEINNKSACENNHNHSRTLICEKNHTTRLNKAIADSGYCSRRKADELIFSGKVKVNDQIILNPALRVNPEDKLEIDNQTLEPLTKFTYLLLHKPIHYICSANDPQNRPSVYDLLPSNLEKLRLFTVGRLDYLSEGLILLTNDGYLAHKLMHPKFEHPKVYEVIVKEKVEESKLDLMRKGMILEDNTRLLPIQVEAFPLPDSRTLLRMRLRQGINRQIRKMCAQLGLTILKLKRTEELNIKLGDLQAGKFRFLTDTELKDLKEKLEV